MKDEGGSAFPGLAGRDLLAGTEIFNLGLTKRELFAALAMQGLLAQYDLSPYDIADCAVKNADALLAELNG